MLSTNPLRKFIQTTVTASLPVTKYVYYMLKTVRNYIWVQ